MAKSKYVFRNNAEPSYEKDVPATTLEFIKAINWYNENCTDKDAAKYLDCDLRQAKTNLTYAWVVRMKDRGFIPPDNSVDTIAQMKLDFQNSIKEKVVVVDTANTAEPVVTINMQERIANKTNDYIAMLELAVDEFGHGEKSDKFNAYNFFLKHEVKPVHANKISEWFENHLSEITDALESDDKEYRDAYARMGKNRLKHLQAVLKNIINDADRLAQNASKTRKPRKKKSVSLDKLVSRLPYKVKDDNYKIQSIKPIDILGASQIWVFNVKSRRLGVYSANDTVGLTVKGSKILDFSVKESFSKILRNPEKTLSDVLNGGKVQLRNLMGNINAKSAPMNGKIGNDTIILRAIK